MNGRPLRYSDQDTTPRPPNVLYDGTRLGLEGNMLVTVGMGVSMGLHIGLSVALGYAVRYADGMHAAAKPFSFFGFLMISILTIIAMSMVLFFLLAIPTMGYSMGLVALLLRIMRKVRGREKLAGTLIGGAMGLPIGIASSALILLMVDLAPTRSAYATLMRWPEIMSIDGIILLWLTLNPVLNAVAGGQIGWRLGKMIEQMSMYMFW